MFDSKCLDLYHHVMASASPRLKKYFQNYSSYHRTKKNQLTHVLGIPMIVVSLLGLMANLGFLVSSDLRIDGGMILIFLALLWYLYVDWKITVPFGLILIGFYFLGNAFPTPLNWVLFVFGWFLQALGHVRYEKKSPAFFQNFTHLLIGPLWIFAKLVQYK